jgi:hypothetical protein
MLTILFALLIHGHHYGWQQPHNPHHNSCVVFHVGCASINPPPSFHDWQNPPPVPVLP